MYSTPPISETTRFALRTTSPAFGRKDTASGATRQSRRRITSRSCPATRNHRRLSRNAYRSAQRLAPASSSVCAARPVSCSSAALQPCRDGPARDVTGAARSERRLVRHVRCTYSLDPPRVCNGTASRLLQRSQRVAPPYRPLAAPAATELLPQEPDAASA